MRVGDSRVRGRGRGQVCRPLMATWPPSPTDTGETKTNKHALRPFLLLTGEKDNTAAILFRGTKDSYYRRHFCWRTKTYNTQRRHFAGEHRLINYLRHFAVGEQRHISHSIACSG